MDCGACEPVCPVVAIFHEEQVPAPWAHYIAIDREFFGSEVSGLGAPSSAQNIGSAGIDHPLLAAVSVP